MSKGIYNYDFKTGIILFVLCFIIPISAQSKKQTDIPTQNQHKIQIDSILKLYSDQTLLKSDTALYNLQIILEFAVQDNNEKQLCEIYCLIALHYNKNYINDSSLYYNLKAWEIGQNLDYDFYYKRLGHLIAENYWQIGDYYNGLNFSLKVKDYFETNNFHEKLYYIYDIIGLIYRELGDFESALVNFKKSYKYALKEEKYGMAGVIYSNIGSLYLKHNEIEKALNYYHKGIKTEEEYGYVSYAGRSYVSVAKIFLRKNEPDSAIYYLNQALNHNKISGDNTGFVRTYSGFGKTYIYYKEYQKAIHYLKKAKKYGLISNKNVTLAEIYKDLALAYDSIGHIDSSYFYFKKYFTLYNTLFDVSKLSEVKKIEYNLQVEKNNSKLKQLEIEKQKTKNTLYSIIIILSVIISSLFISLYFLSIRSKRKLKQINRALLNARIQAEESDKLKSQFLQNISHEIRTPLNGIVGFADMVFNTELSEEEKTDIYYYLNKNSEDLIHTIEDIVDIAHLYTNQYTVIKKEFKIHETLSKLINQIKHSSLYFKKSNIKISIINSEDYLLKSDNEIIKKVLTQLIFNSLKFTEKGEIKINYQQHGNLLKFSVRDTGIGISEEHQKHIFTPFRYANEDNHIKYRGNGLGLSIANELIKLIGGNIGFKSEINKGSIFWFTIPVE